ncbi:hypothetical protein ILUMI_01720, partial [Ignelater luminosus]
MESIIKIETREDYTAAYSTFAKEEKPFSPEDVKDVPGDTVAELPIIKHHSINAGPEKSSPFDTCEFTHSATLEKHNQGSTNEKPFQCNICDHRFTYKSALQDHILVHS